MEDRKHSHDGSSSMSGTALWGAGLLSGFLTFGLALLSSQVASANVQRDYGIVLFVGLPLLQGFATSVFIEWKEPRPFKDCFKALSISLLVAVFLCLVTAFEGIVCVLMAAPLWLGWSLIGVGLARLIRSSVGWKGLPSTVLALPVIALLFQPLLPGPYERVECQTETVISAPPSTVWKFVPALSHIEPSGFWMFDLGVAHPTSIVTGPGMNRTCRLTTGDMSETITTWEPGRRLEFRVLKTPPTMKEFNPFGEVRARHLSANYECEVGRFDLYPLPGGRTRLVGTSTYHYRMAPGWYWNLWTNYIVHHVHQSVFEEIERRVSIRRVTLRP